MKTKKSLVRHGAFLASVLVCTLASFVPVAEAIVCPTNLQPCHNACIDEKALCLLEPVPGGPTFVPPSSIGLAAFYYYVNNGIWQWAFRMGVAIAILNGTVGGFQIVMSNGDQGKIDAGKTRFISSAIGLAVLLLSATILQFLNPVGFQAV